MKLKFKLFILFPFFTVTSNTLFALTLNKMQVNSKQDEPLNAVIDVVYSKGDKASNLKPAIASKENYEANGLSRLPIHSDIQIRLEDSAKGGKIFLISQDIVKDPFLDLLIQIDSEKGRVYKEYTVLLEPPSPKISIKEVKEVKEVKEAKSKEEALEKIDEAVKVEPVKTAQQEVSVEKKVKVIKKSTNVKEDNFRIVKSTKGKTLYQIARENKPSGVTTEQMVLAIYQNNLKAFAEENVNTLIKNKKLKIPPLSYFKNHTHLEARKILRNQNVEWKSKIKKIKKSVIEKKIIDKDAIKIKQLEKELIETKKKLKDISELNIESKTNNSIDELNENVPLKNISLKDTKEVLSEDKSEEEDVDDGVFVSSISDIDENKIEETKIDTPENSGLETIHLLLLVLFFVLLLGLFVIVSRRKAKEKNQTLRSFIDDSPASEPLKKGEGSSDSNEGQHDSYKDETSQKIKKNYLPIADDD